MNSLTYMSAIGHEAIDPLRIAINGRFLSQRITGVQRMAREFVRALDGLIEDGTLGGVEARLLVQDDAALGDLAPRVIPVEVLPGAHGHLWEQWVLPRRVGDGWLLNLGNTAPVLSLMGKRPVAVVLHDISYRLFPDAYRLRYRLAHRLLNMMLARRADPLITVAEAERETIRRYHPAAADRIMVAQNGGWPGDAEMPPRPGKRGYGLYVGSLSRRKNMEGVIATATALARERGLPFLLVGASNPILTAIQEELPADVRALVRWLGPVEDLAALRALYRDAAFLLFPSFYEASALPPMEAMAQGCPVIASRIPSLEERCGNAALYCDPADIGSMRAAARRILDEPGLADALAARGAAHARRFTWRSQALEIVSALGARQPMPFRPMMAPAARSVRL